MENKCLFILRGCPGSGKSLLASELAKGYSDDIICCADDYHMIDGEYKWSVENTFLAYLKCKDKCEELMKNNSERIIIANTNSGGKQFKPYSELAELYGYTVFYLVVENRHNGINSHGVSDDILNKMESRLTSSIKLI